MVEDELSAELHRSLWEFVLKKNKKMEKNHLWQRLGQDEDKVELEEEDDEVT